jgi:hypothetical protein
MARPKVLTCTENGDGRVLIEFDRDISLTDGWVPDRIHGSRADGSPWVGQGVVDLSDEVLTIAIDAGPPGYTSAAGQCTCIDPQGITDTATGDHAYGWVARSDTCHIVSVTLSAGGTVATIVWSRAANADDTSAFAYKTGAGVGRTGNGTPTGDGTTTWVLATSAEGNAFPNGTYVSNPNTAFNLDGAESAYQTGRVLEP